MHRGMASGRPARAHADKSRMIDIADEQLRRTRSGSLGMAAQTQVNIALCQQLGIDGAVRGVTTGATFAQGLVFENERTCLLAVALAAGFIDARHRQPAAWFKDVAAVWIVALRAVH